MFAASLRSHACRNTLRTPACRDLGKHSMILRALWTWRRWIGVWRPKVLRIALERTLAHLGAIDDEQPANLRIKTALDQVVQQGLRHGGVLFCRPCRQRQQRPEAAANLKGGGGGGGGGTDPPSSILSCARPKKYKAAGYRRFGHTRTAGRADAAFGQAGCTAVLARRDLDQHQVHRPFAQQVTGHSLLPARQGHRSYALT